MRSAAWRRSPPIPARRRCRAGPTRPGPARSAGAEFHNITFADELDAAEYALVGFQQYQLDDRLIRRADQPMANRRVLKNTIVNADFQIYDRELVTLIDINQRAFDAAIADGESDLSGWTGWIPYGAGVLILLLVVTGVWPRLAEYR